MKMIELGDTGEKIPVLGLGTWKLGADPEGNIEALRLGIGLGMRLVDTAEMYANEEMVGRAIEGQEIFLCTKVSPDHFRYDDVIKACDRSLRKLGRKQIDLYQLHWPNTSVPISETMRAMEKLVDDGKIRYIGVSNFSIDEAIEAQEAMKRYKIVSNQVEYNILSRSIEDGLADFCKYEKMTAIAYSPLARGVLFDQKHRALERLLEEIGRAHGKSPGQVALNWILSRGNVVAIPKAASAEHVRENAGAADFELGAKELGRIGDFLKTHPQEKPLSSRLTPAVKKSSAIWAKLMRYREGLRNRRG